jgi:hypothetical protein
MTVLWSNSFSLIVSIVALLVSVVSLGTNIWLQKSKRAMDFVAKYVELETQYSRGTDKWDMRLSFVLVMTQAVLGAYPYSKRWNRLLKDQLTPFKKDLDAWEKDEPGYFRNYGSKTASLVYSIVKDRSK